MKTSISIKGMSCLEITRQLFFLRTRQIFVTTTYETQEKYLSVMYKKNTRHMFVTNKERIFKKI